MFLALQRDGLGMSLGGLAAVLEEGNDDNGKGMMVMGAFTVNLIRTTAHAPSQREHKPHHQHLEITEPSALVCL